MLLYKIKYHLGLYKGFFEGLSAYDLPIMNFMLFYSLDYRMWELDFSDYASNIALLFFYISSLYTLLFTFIFWCVISAYAYRTLC